MRIHLLRGADPSSTRTLLMCCLQSPTAHSWHRHHYRYNTPALIIHHIHLFFPPNICSRPADEGRTMSFPRLRDESTQKLLEFSSFFCTAPNLVPHRHSSPDALPTPRNPNRPCPQDVVQLHRLHHPSHQQLFFNNSNCLISKRDGSS